MRGVTVIKMNQETIQAAVQKYLTDMVFKDSQKAEVTSVLPVTEQYSDIHYYEVTISSNDTV